MTPTRSRKRAASARERRKLVDAVDGAEAKRLLSALLAAHPELLAETADLADAQLRAVVMEDVAEDVASVLEELCVEDVWGRAGAQPDGSYVEPSEAAWDLVEETLAPYLRELERRVALGRREEATAVCQGTLLGLYRISQGGGDSLDGWAPDALAESAGIAVETWQKRGARRPTREVGARERQAMRAFVSDALPAWRSFLTRAIGRMPTRSGSNGKR